MKKRTCEEYALFKLNYKMFTEKEMRDALKKEEYEPEEIDETIEALKRLEYIDDKKYIVEYFKSGRKKYWSQYKISYELEQKGINPEMTKSVIEDYKSSDEFEGPYEDRIVALKLGIIMAKDQISEGKSLDDKFFGKVGRRLMGLGHTKRTVYYVIDKLRNPGGIANVIQEDIEELVRIKKEKEKALYQFLVEKQERELKQRKKQEQKQEQERELEQERVRKLNEPKLEPIESH